jgi:hypothetical protein
MTMPKLQAPSLVFYVSDIKRTEAFDRDVLGCFSNRMGGFHLSWKQAFAA